MCKKGKVRRVSTLVAHSLACVAVNSFPLRRKLLLLPVVEKFKVSFVENDISNKAPVIVMEEKHLLLAWLRSK